LTRLFGGGMASKGAAFSGSALFLWDLQITKRMYFPSDSAQIQTRIQDTNEFQ
jgi:hypothetical protein